MADTGATGAVRGGARRATGRRRTPKAAADVGPALFGPPARARGEARAQRPRNAEPGRRSRAGNMQAVLARLAELLDRVEGRQTNTLAAMEESYEAKARRMRAVLADVGIDPGKLPRARSAARSSPIGRRRMPAPFEKQVYRINVARAQVDRLTATLGKVPLRKPVEGEIDTSSGFGVRIDPFLGTAGDAYRHRFPRRNRRSRSVSRRRHRGFRRLERRLWPYGRGRSRQRPVDPLRPPVGNRRPGRRDASRPARPIGRLGSTGRSTGPHLHYETRIDGEAVDPNRFLHAGAKFGVN